MNTSSLLESTLNPRLIANYLLQEVLVRHRSLSDVLSREEPRLKASGKKAFIKELCFGVCRWYFRLNFIAQKLLKKPLYDTDYDIYISILIGLYELLYLTTATHAAVYEAVESAMILKKPWAKNLINALLRNFLRQKEALIQHADQYPDARYSHPKWLLNRLKTAWPVVWQNICMANNEHPPLFLRVNRLKITRENYILQLHEHDIEALIISEMPDWIEIKKPLPVEQIPGFNEGFFVVQDLAAGYAAYLMQLNQNTADFRVLDACAAPGGKTSHILELAPSINLTAIDSDINSINRLRDTLNRLQLSAKVICTDVTKIDSWWDQCLFDRILLDAPCSGTGVIRRHPDIKLLRTENDIKKYAKQQLHLLQTLWPLLKGNGLLLYITCSTLPEENQKVIAAFLSERNDAKEEPLSIPIAKKLSHGVQILPGTSNTDGFFYALLRKLA